jgi:hypothetical protein
MSNDLERAIQRSRSYWFDDGLAEIAIGLILVSIGLMFLAEAYGIVPAGVSSIGLIVLVFAGWWLAGQGVRAAKARITYPRTGYVRYRKPEGRRKSRWMTAAIGAAMGATLATLFTTAPASLSWIPALNGVAVGAMILYMAYSTSLSRFYLLALLSVAIGVSVSVAGVGDILGTGVYFAGIGIAIVLSGVIVLLSYLRQPGPAGGE